MHIALCGSDPLVLKPKKLQECTQITACRLEEKCRRAGGVIKQESTSAEIGRLLFFCFCPHPLSNNGLSVSLHRLWYFLQSPHLLGKPHYQTTAITDWKESIFCFCVQRKLFTICNGQEEPHLFDISLLNILKSGRKLWKTLFLHLSHLVLCSSPNHLKANEIVHWKM